MIQLLPTDAPFAPQLEKVRSMVEVLAYMGNDLFPINSARESLHKQSEFELSEDGTWVLSKKDKKLLTSLGRRGHFTPFTHNGVIFRIKMPIYIARQWFKHTVGFSYNEVSRRYVSEPPEFEFGFPWQRKPTDGIKQGAGEVFNDETQERFNSEYAVLIRHASDLYSNWIARGMAPQQARKLLPVSYYTEFWQTGNVESFARLYKLRVDPEAQLETQQYALAIGEHMSKLFPEAWATKTRDYHGEEVAALNSRIAALEAQLARSENERLRLERAQAAA
jgi:thymidylate synthase (FAD)